MDFLFYGEREAVLQGFAIKEKQLRQQWDFLFSGGATKEVYVLNNPVDVTRSKLQIKGKPCKIYYLQGFVVFGPSLLIDSIWFYMSKNRSTKF